MNPALRRTAVLTALIASACATGTGDDIHKVGVNEDALYVRTSALWPHPYTIPVCFDQAGNSDVIPWARAAAERTWELFGHVDFTGWGRCTSNTAPGLHIMWRDQLGETIGLGTALDGVFNGVRFDRWDRQGGICLPGWTRQACVEAEVVHELGHALGFSHEQNRPDRPATCLQPAQGTNGTVEVGTFDPDSSLNYCSTSWTNRGFLSDGDKAGLQMYYGGFKEAEFGYDQGWRAAKNPRMMADVNRDGRQDVVGFANDGVYVSLAGSGSGYLTPEEQFKTPTRWIADFAYKAGGWQVEYHPRMMADVNADGRADVVGFASDGVYVALAKTTNDGFNAATRWVAEYGYTAGGWRVASHPRMMADVNADGRADVIGFASDGVYVSLANTAGTAFSTATRWVQEYGTKQGWQIAYHPRMMMDVTGDGRADVVGFASDGVWVATAKSTNNGFNTPTRWVNNYGIGSSAGGWTVTSHPRFLARVDGDALPDIVGFGTDHTYVSRNLGGSFDAPRVWARNHFGSSSLGGGWNTTQHIRTVADVSGDGKADVIGFSSKDVVVAVAGASGFGAEQTWAPGYDVADGWTVTEHPRFIAQIDNFAGGDIVGFASDGLYSTSLGIHIDPP